MTAPVMVPTTAGCDGNVRAVGERKAGRMPVSETLSTCGLAGVVMVMAPVVTPESDGLKVTVKVYLLPAQHHKLGSSEPQACQAL